MKYAVVLTVFLVFPAMSYGMEVTNLAALEAGTGGSNFHKEVASLRKMGLVGEDERDLENQIARLSEEQRNRLLAGRSTRSGMQGGGGSFWQWLSGGNQTDGESVYLLRDLHRIALEEQRISQTRLEEVEKLSRRFKIVLVLVGTGLLGSLGANGGLLADLLSGSAEAASSV